MTSSTYKHTAGLIYTIIFHRTTGDNVNTVEAGFTVC